MVQRIYASITLVALRNIARLATIHWLTHRVYVWHCLFDDPIMYLSSHVVGQFHFGCFAFVKFLQLFLFRFLFAISGLHSFFPFPCGCPLLTVVWVQSHRVRPEAQGILVPIHISAE